MYLRLGSLIDVRAGDDVLRLYNLRRPFLFRIRSRVSKIGPLLVSNSPIMLCEVVDDAVRRGTSTRCGTYISFKYG